MKGFVAKMKYKIKKTNITSAYKWLIEQTDYSAFFFFL